MNCVRQNQISEQVRPFLPSCRCKCSGRWETPFRPRRSKPRRRSSAWPPAEPWLSIRTPASTSNSVCTLAARTTRKCTLLSYSKLGKLRRSFCLRWRSSFIRTALIKIYQDWVQRRLVEDCVELPFVKVHRLRIHLRVLDALLLFVFFGHCLHAYRALVNAYYLFVAFLKHLLGESGISSSDIKHSVLLIDIGGYYVLDAAESLVPVERLWVPKLPIPYFVYLSSQYSLFPYWLILPFSWFFTIGFLSIQIISNQLQ